MLYYRYRPYSELSLKELLYSEIYFTSSDECNDPFDSKVFYEFPNDLDKWRKLIEFSLKSLRAQISTELIEKYLNHICSQCPLTYDNVLSQNIFVGISINNENERLLIKQLSKRIHSTLEAYSPDTRYFVSFSKSNTEPLMWSHYADKHKGFCLIFKPIDGNILQYERYKKKSISRISSNGLAEEVPFGMPDRFPLKDIEYKHKVQPLNAFMCLPSYISGDVVADDEQLKIIEEQENHYAQKHINWQYECESRIILPPPIPWIFGGHIEYSNQERLFHYEPTHLIGIIFGARMTASNKERIIEIINERNRWTSGTVDYKRTFFDFVVFDAKLSLNQRMLEIAPSSIISWKTVNPGDPEFSKRLELWYQGWGRELIGTQGKEIFIK